MLMSALLAIPAIAWASSGGSGITPSGGASTTPPVVGRGNVTVTASGNGLTLSTVASTMLRSGLAFTGTASRSAAGQTVEIQRLGHQTDWQWAPTVTATVARNGSFSAIWKTNHIGQFSIRAVFVGAGTAVAASTTSTVMVTVYRPSIATFYGGATMWGRNTACGERLRPSTLGVANRTLKCGTEVALYYHGRTMVVPVIDRGPYANGADWDLTEATSRALDTPGIAKIGAVSLPPQPSAP